MNAGKLDRQVQFLRYTTTDDGFGQVQAWADHGSAVWASKTDVSDAERWRANEVSAALSTRFVVRWSAFTKAITPKDQLVCEGVTYDITGIKETGERRRWLELTCATGQGDNE